MSWTHPYVSANVLKLVLKHVLQIVPDVDLHDNYYIEWMMVSIVSIDDMQDISLDGVDLSISTLLNYD